MAPMPNADHNVLEQQLKDTIQSLHNIMVQVTAYDTTTATTTATNTTTNTTTTTTTTTTSSTSPPPPSASRASRDVLATELTALSRSLQAVHRTATTRTLPQVPPELVQYVDGGRNPDVYTREFVELVRRGNQLMRGKQRAFASFRDVLAGEIESAMPELRADAAATVLAAAAAAAAATATTGGAPGRASSSGVHNVNVNSNANANANANAKANAAGR
ncbi:transcription factor subunit Med10 of mediator complex-domain-containing protein [Xylaria cf. heliscus]|nr:transcription factor subunit Med10 of mediator complex-domain-containing protein [Xylaria cf. heliscus]